MSERVYYKRQFLNTDEHGGSAFVEATVEEINDCSTSFDAEFKVGDCDRVVHIDFGVWSDDTSNARQKIKRLRRTVEAFEAALLAQCDAVDRAQK